MRRIARPDALYGASVSAQTVDGNGQLILNPADFEEIVGVNLAKSTDDIKHVHVERYDTFLAKKSKDAN